MSRVPPLAISTIRDVDSTLSPPHVRGTPTVYTVQSDGVNGGDSESARREAHEEEVNERWLRHCYEDDYDSGGDSISNEDDCVSNEDGDDDLDDEKYGDSHVPEEPDVPPLPVSPITHDDNPEDEEKVPELFSTVSLDPKE